LPRGRPHQDHAQERAVSRTEFKRRSGNGSPFLLTADGADDTDDETLPPFYPAAKKKTENYFCLTPGKSSVLMKPVVAISAGRSRRWPGIIRNPMQIRLMAGINLAMLTFEHGGTRKLPAF
jgi:hypothetical protein